MTIVDYGVCRLAIVQVFSSPAYGQPVSQLLFGEHYSVLSQSQDQKWIQINIHADGVAGWIDSMQHHSISVEYFNQINTSDFKITTDVTSTILYRKNPLTIVMGSIVPITGSELFKMEEQFAFNGESKSLGQRRDFEYLQSIVMKYLNAPHLPGGRNPFGIDSAGLVQMAFKISGYSLPRSVELQLAYGKKTKERRPGDIAFFKGKGGQVDHAGIVLDADKIIHCAGRVRVDYLTEDGILAPESKVFTHMLAGIRRVLV